MPSTAMIEDWPSTTLPSASSAWSVSGSRRDRHDLPADGQDPVDPPDTLLEVAALDGGHRGQEEVPDGVPAEARRLALGRLGEPVLEELVHERLGVGEGGDAVADVPDGRDPEALAQHAGRAAVVGDRDHGRQVAGVLLQAAQERRQARAAADGHDPWATGQEALLVDELDERLAGLVGSERIGQGPAQLDGTEDDDAEADAWRRSGPGPGTAGTGA